MQNYAGNFGMWGPGSDADNFRGSASSRSTSSIQAKAKGYVVANDALKRGASWLKTQRRRDSNDDLTRAYAFYVLAQSGQVNLSDLRYFSDTRGAGDERRHRGGADRRGGGAGGRPVARDLRLRPRRAS